MKRAVCAAMALALAMGCRGETPAPESPPPADSYEALAPAPDVPPAMSGTLELMLYDDSMAATGPQNPTFRVRADVTGDDQGVVGFQNAEAVFFGKDNEEIHVTAERGWLDEGEKQAELEGRIVMVAGTQQITLESLLWDNQKQEILSNKPLHIDDGDTQVEASAMRYYPKRKESLLLTDMIGTIGLAEAIEEAPPAP